VQGELAAAIAAMETALAVETEVAFLLASFADCSLLLPNPGAKNGKLAN
jgi:hypothetical protein